ncbi:MAG: hypothetical protein ACU85E_15365 [Gammaproteobacteria bacterium]
MSEMRDFNSDDERGRSPVIIERIPSHQSLVKVNRLLLYTVFSLMVVVFLMGFFLMPSHNALSSYKRVQLEEVYRARANPVLTAEIDNLKAQLIGLVSGSIESKLRTLEQSVKLGTVSYSLGTIEDLKNDVKVLRSYSESVKEDKVRLTNERLLNEMSQLKDLIYFTLASCGLMVAAVAGIWIKNRKWLPYKASRRGLLGKQ